MANPEWGAKHICHSCGTRYYDLQRSPVVCPKCNTQYDPEAFLKSRRTRAAAVEDLPASKAAVKKKAEPKAKVVADEPKADEPKANEPKADEPEANEPEANEPEEVVEAELEADADTVALDELDKADDTADPILDVADDDDDDDDVGTVVDIVKDDDPNA